MTEKKTAAKKVPAKKTAVKKAVVKKAAGRKVVLAEKAAAPEVPTLKCGFVAIVGRPNVGKSTLLNYIVGEKVSIVSDVPQTTRQMLRGIYTDKRGQIIFIDTPGWHIGRDHLDRYMNRTCTNAIDGVDCIIYLVDTFRRVGEEERRIAERLKHIKIPVVLGLNKIDQKGPHLPEYIELWESVRGQSVGEQKDFAMIPVSGRDGTRVDTLLEAVFSFLPVGPMHYEPDVVTDAPRRQVVADIIREKLFRLTREELPHSIAVVVDGMRPAKGKTTYINATILVERETQKEIVIGSGGALIKQVGSLARADLVTLLETRVYLELFVKVKKDWRDSQHLLADMGYVFESLGDGK